MPGCGGAYAVLSILQEGFTVKKRQFSLCTRLVGGFLATSAVFAAAAGLFFWGAMHVAQRRSALASAEDAAPVIVIDAGHGGEDGGASAADGTLEKNLNLSVAEILAQLLGAAGYDVRMTRTDDRMLYDRYGDLTDYTGHRKTYDLRNRLRFAGEADAALFVSIHMNKFPQEKYSGLQVYYAAAEGSRAVADAVQNTVKTCLQPDNDRQTKQAGSAIYLLNRIDIPAVMIECGFLSNDAELQRLKDAEYRRALALCIACAIAECMG